MPTILLALTLTAAPAATTLPNPAPIIEAVGLPSPSPEITQAQIDRWRDGAPRMRRAGRALTWTGTGLAAAGLGMFLSGLFFDGYGGGALMMPGMLATGVAVALILPGLPMFIAGKKREEAVSAWDGEVLARLTPNGFAIRF